MNKTCLLFLALIVAAMPAASAIAQDDAAAAPERKSLEERRKAKYMKLKKYEAIHWKASSTQEEKIRGALNDDTQMEFIETPLQDVVEFLEDLHGIQIIIDRRALDAVGLSTDSPITQNLKGIPLAKALNVLLREYDLDYVVQDEVLQITTRQAAADHVETRVYDVDVHRLENIGAEEIAEVIRKTIAPSSWRGEHEEGRTIERKAAIAVLPGALVITQNQAAHAEIVDLMQQLNRHDGAVKARRKLRGLN